MALRNYNKKTFYDKLEESSYLTLEVDYNNISTRYQSVTRIYKINS